MQPIFFHTLARLLWALIVTAVVLLAFYVSFGRLLMAAIGTWEERILEQLDGRVPFQIEASALSGNWRSFSPELVLSGLRLTLPDGSTQPLELAEGRLEVDVFSTLLNRSLTVRRLHLSQLDLQGEVAADGTFRLLGMGGSGRLRQWLQQFLLDVDQLTVSDLSLALALPDGGRQDLSASLDLNRDGGRRQLWVDMTSSRGMRVAIQGKGVGNPFRPDAFSGELYLDIDAGDLGAVRSILPRAGELPEFEGVVDLELWLAWRYGEPLIEAHLDASDLVLADPEGHWRLPLDLLSLDARLVERRRRWTLFAADVMLRQGRKRLALPRVQVDAWGDSLRLRAEQLSISQLNLALVDLDFTPEPLERTLRTLQPGGRLSSLQLSVADFHAPKTDWELLANFSDLEIDSWRGAPGAIGAAGYIELSESGGSVVLDAADVSLEFPTVYRQPLAYDEVFGTVYIDWYSDAVVLSSGVITTRAEEGEAHALFGLNIPLQPSPVGLEMDLLVGLEGAPAGARGKYLPYKLNAGLLDWLENSIDDGWINQGAFLWRGSLRRGAKDARTVQLFFDASDTDLTYQPDWPAVNDLEALVLVDDTSVSVWGERARLYDSEVRHLSAEAWRNEAGQILLQVDARTRGRAEDGLRVVRESPLGRTTAGVFDQWRLDGSMDAALALDLNLGDPEVSPGVRFAADLEGGELDIRPGDLTLGQISGRLGFDSRRGFYGEELRGSLWGRMIDLEVGQVLGAGRAYRVDRSPVRVAFDTALDPSDLQRWLQLDTLGLASGRAAASVEVLVPPGRPPTVRVDTDLDGIALDLPRPWALAREDAAELAALVTLSGGGARIDLQLERELALALQVAQGRLEGAALGVSGPAGEPAPGRLDIRGRVPMLHAADWQTFAADYLAPVALAATVNDGSTPAAGGALQLSARDLRIDALQLWGREIRDAALTVEQAGSRWQASAETPWLKGSVSRAGPGQPWSLAIERLALDQIPPRDAADGPAEAGTPAAGTPAAGTPAAGTPDAGTPDAGTPIYRRVPDMDVVARGLTRRGQPMGELSLALRSGPQGLEIGAIEGRYAGLRFLPEHANRMLWGDSGTAIDWRLGFADLAETLARFDYAPVLETSGGEIGAALSWPGTPAAFGLAEAQGTLRIAASDGRFLEAPSGAGGALRVVSILNLAEIVARLSLSHMFESGIPFRTLETDVALGDGLLDVRLLEVVGASSRFQFSGSSAMATRTLNGELVVTLPVANNLPWVAALAAGPAVAAGVFVVSKMFEKQVDQLSSAVYAVGGSWEEPEVSLSRIFDVAQEPVQSGTAASGAADPGATDPSVTDPSVTDPSATDPSATDAGATDSGKSGPGPAQPGAAAAQPAGAGAGEPLAAGDAGPGAAEPERTIAPRR